MIIDLPVDNVSPNPKDELYLYTPGPAVLTGCKHYANGDLSSLCLTVPLRKKWEWPDCINTDINTLIRRSDGVWCGRNSDDCRPAKNMSTLFSRSILPPDDGPDYYYR